MGGDRQRLTINKTNTYKTLIRNLWSKHFLFFLWWVVEKKKTKWLFYHFLGPLSVMGPPLNKYMMIYVFFVNPLVSGDFFSEVSSKFSPQVHSLHWSTTVFYLHFFLSKKIVYQQQMLNHIFFIFQFKPAEGVLCKVFLLYKHTVSNSHVIWQRKKALKEHQKQQCSQWREWKNIIIWGLLFVLTIHGKKFRATKTIFVITWLFSFL